MDEDFERLTLEHAGSALTFASSKAPDGDRVLVLWTTPTDGTLPVMAMTRDEAFRALEWLSRWLQKPP